MLPTKTTQTLDTVRLLGTQNPDGNFLLNWTVNLVYRMDFINNRLLREVLELREYKRQREGGAL